MNIRITVVVFLAFLLLPAPATQVRRWRRTPDGAYVHGPFRIARDADRRYWHLHYKGERNGGWKTADEAIEDAEYWITLQYWQSRSGCECSRTLLSNNCQCATVPGRTRCECLEETRRAINERKEARP